MNVQQINTPVHKFILSIEDEETIGLIEPYVLFLIPYKIAYLLCIYSVHTIAFLFLISKAIKARYKVKCKF